MIKEGSPSIIDWGHLAWYGGNGLLVLSSYPLIYLFEKSFGFLSDATLMELSDTNQPLLRALAEKAPGTFQHTMQVANLAEEATIKIGGNPLLVRAGALYHDIGKLTGPVYYAENQTSNYNPHKHMNEEESAQIIKNHVEEGIKLAKKHKLPAAVIDFIRTHHGTSKVKYFYQSFLNKYPHEQIDVKKFTYSGPKPYSKETAVFMLSDSIEAASRSLTKVTAQVINDLVENIVNWYISEGQFDEANITFRDISIIKDIFKKKLRNIYHVRVQYPQAEGGGESQLNK